MATGTLVMSFRGLCIHVNRDSGILPAAVGHRIVAVNAANGALMKVAGLPVLLPAHHCFIEADQATTNALWNAGVPRMLDGWNVQVGNALDTPPVMVSLGDVPKLSTYSPGMTLWPDLGNSGAPAQDACCFVDIQAGSVVASKFDVPGLIDAGFYSTWTIATKGEPQLNLVSRDGTAISVTVPSTPSGATLSNGVPGSFVLHNSTTSNDDSQYDFGLYYLARQGGIPISFAGPLPGENGSPGQFFDMTTSCSNSQFP